MPSHLFELEPEPEQLSNREIARELDELGNWFYDYYTEQELDFARDELVEIAHKIRIAVSMMKIAYPDKEPLSLDFLNTEDANRIFDAQTSA